MITINITLPGDKEDPKEDLKKRLMSMPKKESKKDNSDITKRLDSIRKSLDVPRHIGGSV